MEFFSDQIKSRNGENPEHVPELVRRTNSLWPKIKHEMLDPMKQRGWKSAERLISQISKNPGFDQAIALSLRQARGRL
ncbi:MAG: hypothetical protein MZV64_26080 [Ignavibacteriales bacterium]|nr:hypothetical protein [Ignavibacteriales bacterium]